MVEMTVDSVNAIADKSYFGVACFSVHNKDKLEIGEVGFGFVTKNGPSTHYLQEIQQIVVTAENTTQAASKNGWDFGNSTTDGGGLSENFYFTFYAKKRTLNLGIKTVSNDILKCYISNTTTTSFTFNSSVTLTDWTTAEGRYVNMAHLSNSLKLGYRSFIVLIAGIMGMLL